MTSHPMHCVAASEDSPAPSAGESMRPGHRGIDDGCGPVTITRHDADCREADGSRNGPIPWGAGSQVMADSPDSPVRMRMASSIS